MRSESRRSQSAPALAERGLSRISRARLCYTVAKTAAIAQDSEESGDMASPQAERERVPEIKAWLGRQDVRIDLIVTDAAEIKTRRSGQDCKIYGIISRQDGKIYVITGEVSQLNAGAGGAVFGLGGPETVGGSPEIALASLEARIDKHYARMRRLLYTLLGIVIVDCALVVKIAFF